MIFLTQHLKTVFTRRLRTTEVARRYTDLVECPHCLKLEAELEHLRYLSTKKRNDLRTRERTASRDEYHHLDAAHDEAANDVEIAQRARASAAQRKAPPR
jgi:hypothetical protein